MKYFNNIPNQKRFIIKKLLEKIIFKILSKKVEKKQNILN